MSERNQKVKVLTGCAELFGFNFTEMSMAIYLDSLEDLKAEDLKRILTYGIKTNAWRFMPRPGEILSLIRVSNETKISVSAKRVFEEILHSIRHNGRNAGLMIDERASDALRQIGGIHRIADASDEELVWIRKDFEKSYEQMTEYAQIEARKSQLSIGTTDQSRGIKQITSAIGKPIP